MKVGDIIDLGKIKYVVYARVGCVIKLRRI